MKKTLITYQTPTDLQYYSPVPVFGRQVLRSLLWPNLVLCHVLPFYDLSMIGHIFGIQIPNEHPCFDISKIHVTPCHFNSIPHQKNPVFISIGSILNIRFVFYTCSKSHAKIDNIGLSFLSVFYYSMFIQSPCTSAKGNTFLKTINNQQHTSI